MEETIRSTEQIRDKPAELMPDSLIFSGTVTAAETNVWYRTVLSRGEKRIQLHFDRPTQTGNDSDHFRAENEVGRAGPAICSVDDMETLFADSDLRDINPVFANGGSAFILIAFYATMAKKRGVELKQTSGNLRIDPANKDGLTGSAIFPPAHSLRIHEDFMEWFREALPNWNIVPVSVSPGRENDNTLLQDPVVPQAVAEHTGIPAFDEKSAIIREEQTIKLAALRRQRDLAKCDQLMQLLNDVAASEENIMPAVLEAAEARCTLGEIADTLREVFGEY